MCQVELNGVFFSYKSGIVLNDLSFAVNAGDFVVVVGPNGAGKTTTLKIIAGLIVPQKGQVYIDGNEVARARKKGLIGYVPQSYGKNAAEFPATVEEVVALGMAGDGLFPKFNKQASQHIINHMLELVGMSDYVYRRIGELSGGQQQRVMVAKALACNPRLLLLDEPTSGIDYEARIKIYGLLSMLNQSLGITIIMVSHDINEAVRVASKVVCIDHGLCYYGDSDKFKSLHVQPQHLWYQF